MNFSSQVPHPSLASIDEIAALEEQIAAGMATRESHYALARAYDGQDRFAEAEAQYIAALNADPDFAPAYHDLGQLYVRWQHPVEAQQALARYLRIAPTLQARTKTLQQLKKLTGNEPLVCDGCGRKSPLAEAFQFKQNRLLCPRCRLKQPPGGKPAIWNHSLFWVALLGGVALITYPTQNEYHFFTAGIFIISLLLPLVLFIHEAAHALTALVLGGKVYAFIIGQGDVLWQKQVGSCLFVVKRDFQNGMARFGFPARLDSDIRWRYFIAIGAPLVLHLLIVLVGVQFFPIINTEQRYNPGQLFVFTNLFMFILNAIPRMATIEGWEHPTDGAILWRMVRGGYTVEELQFASLTNEAMTWLQAGQKEAAAQAFEKMLAYPQLPPNGRGIVENNVAWILLLLNQAPVALEHARVAYALLPWHPAIEGTFGAVLVETNASEEGIYHLLEAEAYTVAAEHHASHFAHLALGYAQLGNRAESQRYWEQAIKLAPDYETITHIRPKLASMGY